SNGVPEPIGPEYGPTTPTGPAYEPTQPVGGVSNGVPEPIGPEYDPTAPASALQPPKQQAVQTGPGPTGAEQTGQETGGGRSDSGGAREPAAGGRWALEAQEVTYRTNDPLEAAQLFHNARASGK